MSDLAPGDTKRNVSDDEKDAAAVKQTLGLCHSKDNTSRFVGLTLLKSLLDGSEKIRNDHETVKALWDAISSKFLDGLLRATENEKKSREEASHMRDLAVAVIRIFSILLQQTEDEQDAKLLNRSAALVRALGFSSSETTVSILQTLATIVSGSKGASTLLEVDDLQPLIEVASQQALVLDVCKHALSRAPLDQQVFQEKANSSLASLIANRGKVSPEETLEFLADVVVYLPPEDGDETPWLEPSIQLIQESVLARPSQRVRRASALLSSILVQTYTTKASHLLFSNTLIPGATDSMSEKSFAYVFMNLVLIDIRASFPSLMELLKTSEYPMVSQRLAASFNVVSAFVGYLIHSMDEGDDEDEDNDDGGNTTLPFSPDLLLKLRAGLSETISLTIEYLRDRWDERESSITPSNAKQITSGASSSTRPSSHDFLNVFEDPLTLASVRAMTLWLREDDNAALREEAAGTVDVLLSLYAGKDGFRTPVLLALEPIMETQKGQDAFHLHQGSSIIKKDLHNLQDAKDSTESPADIDASLIQLLLQSSLDRNSASK